MAGPVSSAAGGARVSAAAAAARRAQARAGQPALRWLVRALFFAFLPPPAGAAAFAAARPEEWSWRRKPAASVGALRRSSLRTALLSDEDMAG